MSCVCHAFASVHCCLVFTCREKADLWLSFAISNCVFVTFPCVSLVRCGTCLNRLLIFANFLILCAYMFILISSTYFVFLIVLFSLLCTKILNNLIEQNVNR